MIRRVAVLLLALIFVGGSTYSQVEFEEVSLAAGIQHMHQFGPQVGGGVACFDYDNDGWEDIYLCGGEASDKLYRNLGDGTFEDVTTSSGISIISNSTTTGVVTGDINNDGHREILVTTFFGSELVLFYNNGNGTFTMAANTAIPDLPNWTSAASFGDFDKDGLLDLYAVSYVFSAGFIYDSIGDVVGYAHDCDPNYLFRNNGDLTFSDVTNTYGVGDYGCGLATAFTDYDNDADVDLVIVNDFGDWVEPNQLFENDFGQNDFVQVSAAANMQHGIYGMGVAIGDYDRDADLDYYFTNLGRNVLDKNVGGVFEDWTEFAGVENDSVNGAQTTGWGCFFFDSDNDGWPDLFVSNGLVPSAEFNQTAVEDPNKLFLNNGDGTFDDVSAAANIDAAEIGRGAAYADFDNDGKLDIILNNSHQNEDSTQVELYHNISNNQNNWLKVKLTGTESNRDAFGAHARLVVNGTSTLMEVGGGSSHASQNSSILHFGLGSNSDADSLIVTFPSGTEEVLVDVEANQVVEVIESTGPVSITNDLDQVFSNVRLFNGTILFESNRLLNENIRLAILDMSGRQIAFLGAQTIELGTNMVHLPISLSSGLYVVRFDAGGNTPHASSNHILLKPDF